MNSWMRTDNSIQGSQAKLINLSCPSRLRLLPRPCVSNYVLKIQKTDPAHDKEFVKIFEKITIRKVLARKNVGHVTRPFKDDKPRD